MSDTELEIDDDHPLALELSSLRTAVARFQHEAYTSAVKLQRHSLESAMAIERAQVLEQENAAARAELAALRSHPNTTPHPAELQLSRLTLALRRESDNLTLAEDALRTRTSQLADVQGAEARAHHAAENAFALAAGARAREEDAIARERALMLKLRVTEEEGQMMDRTVREYADLVRDLERRQGLPSSPPPSDAGASNRMSQEHDESEPMDALQEEKAGLHKLAEEFMGENEGLRDEFGRMQVELEGTRAELEAERKAAEEERTQLSNALTELQLLKHDDNAAAKMVSRSTDTLQKSLESLKARHAATTATLHMQAASAQSALAFELRQSSRLRNVLEEATEELAREAYGRRREIALRLAVVGREDQLVEALRRWVRRTQETRAKEDVPIEQRLDSIVSDAGDLLALVDGAALHEADTQDTSTSAGSVARIVVARDTVSALVEELQLETERRMQLERVLGRAEVDEEGRIIPPLDHEPPTPPPKFEPVNIATEVIPEAIPEVVKVDAATSPISPPSPKVPVQVSDASPEDPRSPAVTPFDFPADLPPVQPTPFDREPTAIITLHQPAPRSAIGSPAFLSPLSSPSPSPPIPTQENTIVATSPGSLALQDSIIASTNEFDTTKSPSSPASSISQLSSKRRSPPLLAELGTTKTRYDELQRAFRDCHLALREFGQTLQTLRTTSTPTSALQTIFSRLDDFNEDVRVELEIRIADEERIARGYATLLSVPGAITSEAEAQDVERAVRAFVDGSDAAVARALNKFYRKRDDLEHDIAALKLAMHEVPQPPPPQPQQLQPESQFQSQAQSRPTTPASGLTANASWTSLAASLFTGGSSRPASPSPTFGSVVTSLRGRRVMSSSDGSGPGPLAALQRQFRIPMPDLQHHQAPPPPSPGLSGPKARTASGGVIPGKKPTGLARSVEHDSDVE
ncbi:hypothetical protein EI94DRAFT_1733027 [Lactarius quietus]|nr:hypothetical protein EI94DRAFT_1733027 [Lactarius quietus]